MRARTVLTFVDPAKPDAHLNDALDFAELMEAHLSVAIVSLVPQPPVGTYYSSALIEWGNERKQAEKDLAWTQELVKEALAKRDLSGDIARHVVNERDMAALAGMHARYADLTFLFRPSDPGKLLYRQLLAGLIFQSGRPAMIVPHDGKPVARPKRPIIAWNGSPEAAKALHASLDLIIGAEEVVVVMVDPVERANRSGEEPGFDVGALLARHGFRVDIERLHSRGEEPGVVILDEARRINADLLVMGAYGHSRLREWVLGGSSRTVQEQAHLPVLTMH